MFGEPESTTASTLDKYGVKLGDQPEKPFEKADAANPTVDEKTALGAGPIVDEEYARQMERRATLGSLRKKRQLDADFLRDLADPSVASDNAKLFERCNQYVSDRYVPSHNNGNVLNDMQPFTDAQAYASTLTALIKDGGDPAAISTEQFRAVRDAYAAGNRDELMRVLGISKTKWQFVKAGPVTTVPLSVDKTQDELDEEINDGVSRVMSQNYLHLYNMMRPELTAKGAWLVDKTIKTGKFDPEDMATFLEIERNDKEEGRSVRFLIQAARPTKQNWWADTGYDVWYQTKDMLEGAFRKLGEPMQAVLEAEVVSDLQKEAVLAHRQRVEGGMDAEESMRILNEDVAAIEAESLLEPRKRAELRREKLVLDEFTRHKSWEGYNWLQRSLTGAVTTLPYMGVTAVPGVGFVVNVASHLQDVEDNIIREGGDPEQAKAFRLVSAVAWAGIEKMQFEGFFGKAMTRMEKRALWLEGSRLAYGKLAKSYTKEWTAKEISETVEEGLQGGLEALETDLGLVGNPDPKIRKDVRAMLRDTVGGFVNDMKESAGSMGILALVGTGKAVYQESRRQYRAGIDGESLKEFFKRRDLVDTVIDGSWAEGDGDKVAKRKEVFNKLIDLWAKAGHEKTPLGEVAAQIEEQFGFTEDQAKSVVNFLEAKDTLTEMAVGMFKGAVDPQAAAQSWVDQKLAGGEFQFIVGNDGTFDVGRLFQFFPGVEVETVDVDADGKPIAATDETEQPAFEEDARLAGLRDELAQLEKAIAEAPNRKARRPLEIQHRKVERKIRDIERQDEQKKAEWKPVEKPTAVGQRIRITQTIKDADGNDVKKTWELMLDHSVPDITAPDFATSVSNEAVRTGMPVEYNGGQTVITADNQAAFTDWLRDFIATDKELATSWLKAHGFQTGGNFAPETDASNGIVGTIRLMRGSSPLVAKGGNYTLSHEFFHAFTAAADQMGLLTDDLVGTFKQLFGDPRGTEEKFNEEAAADAFRDWLRGELDFSHISEDRRGLVEKLIDGIFGAFRDMFAAVTGKKPLTPSEKVTLRDAQIAAFEAVRNGDLRGMSKFAGIDFAEDRKKADKAKADAEAKAKKAEEDAKRGKSGPTVGFRRKGVKPPEDASADEEVPTVEPTAAAAEAVASAAPGSVPVRTGSKRKVFTPNYAMSVDTELAWVSLDDLLESTADRDIQMRDRSRASSTEQVHNISKPRRRLADGTYEGFAPEGLLPSDTSDRGAPIIGGGGHIISGHGRYRVLNALAQAGRFGEYLAAAQQYAADAGIAHAPSGMRNPVLVHRITSALSREHLVKFADLSNKSGLLQMSLAGNAENDARNLTPNMLRLYNPGANGNLMAASNRPFMIAFLRAVGAEDSLMNADKTKILPEAATRVQRALMVALFGNDEAVRPMMQYLIETAADVSLGTLSRTLMANAGQLLAMKGQHGSLSIVPAVASAAKLYVAWRAAQSSSPNMSFSDYLHTDDLFEAHASPLDTAVALLLETPYFDRVLRKYGELVANEAADNQGLLGIAGTERHSSVQLLAMAERAVVEKDAAGNPVTPYVTLDPADPSYALEEQTPPAVSAAPEPTPEPTPEQPETPAPIQAAATVLNPPTDAPFEPTEVARGTAQLPNRNAQGIKAHQVNADGTIVSKNGRPVIKDLPSGAWNYLRGPYDVKHPPRTGSAQDRGGRGLGISNPPVALDDQGRCWNRIFPHFQGNKTEMADRTSQAIRKNMTKAERGHYRTLVDYFGGGGCWGLYHALTNFPNVKNLVINEWEQGRLTKIRLLHELDGAVADMARDILIGTRERYEKTYRACLLDNGQETGSGTSIANGVDSILNELLEGRGEDARGVLFAFLDCAHTMLSNKRVDENGNPTTDPRGTPSFDAGVEAILANLKEDGKKAKEAADALKARGGNITYRQGDAASFDDAPHGDDVMTVCDPPYYLTAGYNGQVSVPLDTDMGWSYRTTQRLLDKLVDSGDGIIYTDEAWWHKEGYKFGMSEADMNGLFGGDMLGMAWDNAEFQQEQEVLLGIINSLDHFDVAGRVAGRQEVLGVHHGHTVGRGTLDGQAAGGADGGDVRPDVSGEGADASGSGSVRSSVRRVGRGVEGEDRAARRDYRGGRRGGYADRVIARETCVQAIVDALDGALGDYADESSAFGDVARDAASQVRDDRLADYAQFVGEHVAGSKDGEIFVDGELPIPNEMRKDNTRFSIHVNTLTEQSREAVANFARGEDAIIERDGRKIAYNIGKSGHITTAGRIKGGNGVMHIVYARMMKDGASLEEAVETAVEVADAIENGEEVETRANKHYVRKGNIEGIYAKNFDGSLVLTGYKIDAGVNGGDKLVPPELLTTPPPRKEDVVAAFAKMIAQPGAEVNPDIRFSVRRGDNRAANYGIINADDWNKFIRKVTRDREGRSFGASVAARLGRDADYAGGERIDGETLKAVFESFGPDEWQNTLFGIVYPVAERLGVTFDVISAGRPDAEELGAELAGHVILHPDVIDASDSDVPTTILHELIHSVSTYAIDRFMNDSGFESVKLSPAVSDAVRKINKLFTDNLPWIKGLYGATSLDEFVAELANPAFRRELLRRGFWDKVVDFLVDLWNDIIGNPTVTRGSAEYNKAVEALNTLLAVTDPVMFDQAREAASEYLRQHPEMRDELSPIAQAEEAYSRRRAQAESDLLAVRYSVRTSYSDAEKYTDQWLEGAAHKGDMTAIAEWFDRRWSALTARVRKHKIGFEDAEDLVANIRATCFEKFSSDRNRPKYNFGKFVYGAIENLVLDTVNRRKGGVGTRENLVLDEAAYDNDKRGESREDRIDLVAAPSYDHNKDAARQRVDEFLSHYTGQRREIFEEVKLDGKDINMLAKAYGVSVDEINALCDAMVAEWVSGAYKTRSMADDEPFKRPAVGGADDMPKSRIVNDWKNGTINWGPEELKKRTGKTKRHRAEVPEQVLRVFRLATAYPEATTKELAAVLGISVPRIPEAIRRGVEKYGFKDPRLNGRKLRERSSRYSVRMGGNRRGYNAEDLVKGYTAAKILAGKEITPEDVDKIAKMLGKPNLVAADILTAARATAERKTRSASFKARAADATLMSDLADDALRERVGKQIDDAIVTGAGISDPDVGAAVQEAANRYATKSLDAAKGFTAREMEQKLPISLADAIFAEAEYARSPEEQAKLDEMKRKREEEREAEKKAAEELGMSLAEYRLMQAEQEEENTVYTEPSVEQKAYLNEIMDRARMRKELNDADEARRQARRKRQQNAGEGDGETDLGDGGEGADEGILPRTMMRRIAPIFGSADMFALFLTEWCADEIVRKHPEIPNTDQMWKNRTAIKELVRTAQNILGDLASDVLGRPSVNAERNYADRAILGLAERKSYRGILREIAYVYDMIHDRALKMSRRTLIRDLVKDIKTKAAVKGRFKATTEKWQRGIDARTEMWARHLLPIIQMNEEQLSTEKARLTAIVNEYNRDSADNGYEADNFQEYRDACDKLALMEKYGAMKTWMPSRIIPAAQEIRDELNGRRAEFEAYRLQRDEANERIRSALVKAMEAGGTEAYRKAAGKIVEAAGKIGASLNGNLTLEMRNLVRYCKDEEARKAALDAIEELAILIGQASETYRVTLGTAHKEVNEGLEQIYGSAEKALKHLLEEKIPEEVAVKIFNQSRQELPTYGQLLQLYASCLQADYKDNLEKHNRANQLDLMKATLTDQDLQLHAWAIEWYANNRQALSDAVDAITGLSVASPDRLYCPVRVLREPSGFPVEALAWSPVPSALNRRVSHGLDFDERYNFLTLLQEQCEVRAQLVGYGEAGIRMRDTIAHHDVQEAAAKYVSRADIKAVTNHVRDVLTQGIEKKSNDPFFGILNFYRKWIARFYLSGNLPSSLKQLASRPVWANEVGFLKAAEYYLSAFTPEGWARVRELVDTDGYRARYLLGWSEETQYIIRNPSKNKLLKYLGKFYDAGMWLNKGVDMLSCLWMAQGFYGDAKQRFIDLGFSEDDAKAKAATLTWSVCENGQQSGRIENLNRVQREHPEFAGAIFQFMTAYLLQNNYEIQAAKECYAGTPGAKGRLLRAIVINHILIPGFVAMVEMAWHAVMGVEPPEDPEEWSQYTKDLVYSMALGPAAPLYMWSQIGTGLYDKLTGRKRKGGNRHTTPAEGILEIGDKVGTLIYNAGKYGLQEFTALDFEEELTVEQLQDDLLRAASAVYAPARHTIKAIKNREE